MMGFLAFVGFAATVPAANWMIGHIGMCVPDGPCLLPVGFGLMAPSGVLIIGASLVLRDAVHSLLGWRWALAAIMVGAVLSGLVADPALALASVAALLISETADLVVYSPLRRRSLGLAVLASGAVGAVVDSAVFLGIAFGSLEFLAGQLVGKLWVSVVACAVLVLWRSRMLRLG